MASRAPAPFWLAAPSRFSGMKRPPARIALAACALQLVATLLLYVLAACVMLAWFIRLRPAFARVPPLLIALVLLAGGMTAFVQCELVAFHEIWAGLLIALSLALRRRGRWVAAVAFGMIAMLVRETVGLYVAIMAALAWLA